MWKSHSVTRGKRSDCFHSSPRSKCLATCSPNTWKLYPENVNHRNSNSVDDQSGLPVAFCSFVDVFVPGLPILLLTEQRTPVLCTITLECNNGGRHTVRETERERERERERRRNASLLRNPGWSLPQNLSHIFDWEWRMTYPARHPEGIVAQWRCRRRWPSRECRRMWGSCQWTCRRWWSSASTRRAWIWKKTILNQEWSSNNERTMQKASCHHGWWQINCNSDLKEEKVSQR